MRVRAAFVTRTLTLVTVEDIVRSELVRVKLVATLSRSGREDSGRALIGRFVLLKREINRRRKKKQSTARRLPETRGGGVRMD